MVQLSGDSYVIISVQSRTSIMQQPSSSPINNNNESILSTSEPISNAHIGIITSLSCVVIVFGLVMKHRSQRERTFVDCSNIEKIDETSDYTTSSSQVPSFSLCSGYLDEDRNLDWEVSSSSEGKILIYSIGFSAIDKIIVIR